MVRAAAILIALTAAAPFARGEAADADPYTGQVAEQVARLRSSSEAVRAGAAEALGFLRAYRAADELRATLSDASPAVRREAAMALAWCGGRADVPALLAALGDADWSVRQAARVALTNLTGMELPFDALDEPADRAAQTEAWRGWWAKAPPDRPPADVLALLPADATAPPPPAQDAKGPTNLALRCHVTASTTYKGPPGVLTDGRVDRSTYWQTKNVPFPQHCTVDLGRVCKIGCVAVHQYGPGFCMTDCELATSADGRTWQSLGRRKGRTPPRLVVTFPPREARYVRVTSYDTQRRTYPTTFLEIQVSLEPLPAPPAEPTGGADDPDLLRRERGLRALGALGGTGAAVAAANVVRPYALGRRRARSFAERTMVHAGIRSLGRLGGADGLDLLVAFLRDAYWARYAADALGDCRDDAEQAAAALLAAYPACARDAAGKAPQTVPRDDRPGFSAVDRMYETPFAIASALARLPWRGEANLARLREIAPLLLANLPGDFDGAMLYEPEAGQQVTAWLLGRAGVRRAACEAAFARFGQPARAGEGPHRELLAALARRATSAVPNAAAWLPAVCDRSDTPRLTALLDHDSGWVRMNAAKALRLLGAAGAARRLAELLAGSRPEADYGYCPTFIKDEYNAPAPRWREALVRALGRLGSGEHVPLLARLLADERNALGIRYAAAVSLDEIGSPAAIEALRLAEARHAFHSVRLAAREALWRRGLLRGRADHAVPAGAPKRPNPAPAPAAAGGIVFIRGPNRMPNCFQIDIWRQTYSTTDSGPTYRVGRNLHVLRPGRPGGRVEPLTRFADGWVADCEVSWDARRVLFARRGEKDPWWHVWEIGADGSGLRQLTRGPYHDVQPAYLPDGRIVFSSSRIGLRDEYHGYHCTGLAVMGGDGGRIRCIGFNLGRDNEPTVLPDGRIAFSRLEVFYSRLKTEMTVQAAFPDGTRNVTLYGPERRAFWRRVTRKSGERWWGEAPPRHRVLRLTQAQPFGDDRLLCASTGGLTLVGESRLRESILPHEKTLAVTSPFPLGDGRVLCAASVKKRNAKGRFAPDVDLGLYVMDAATGAMTALYNDPATAEFEPRPLAARRPPPALIEDPPSRSYTARLFCSSARICQESRVAARGKLVRVIEGLPLVARHQTHTNPGEVWRNHTGTHARVLGTVPLAADGSFHVEVPADRLLDLQVLDSDRRVVGNQLIWMYARPGETRSCVGCHEPPESTALPTRHPEALRATPTACLPRGGEFSYRAKVWLKGTLPDEAEERTRTVRAVNLLGR